MQKIWNNCELIYTNGVYHGATTAEITQEFMNYCELLRGYPQHNVWYDTRKGVVFGLDLNWQNAGTMEPIFTNSQKDFLQNPKTNLEYLVNKHTGGDLSRS